MQKTLSKAYDALVKAKESKNADTIATADLNYRKAVKAAGALIVSTKDSRLGAAVVLGADSPLFKTFEGKIVIVLIVLLLLMVLRKIYISKSKKILKDEI